MIFFFLKLSMKQNAIKRWHSTVVERWLCNRKVVGSRPLAPRSRLSCEWALICWRQNAGFSVGAERNWPPYPIITRFSNHVSPPTCPLLLNGYGTNDNYLRQCFVHCYSFLDKNKKQKTKIEARNKIKVKARLNFTSCRSDWQAQFLSVVVSADCNLPD